MKISLAVLALVLGTALGRPQFGGNFGNFGVGNFVVGNFGGGNFGGGNFGGGNFGNFGGGFGQTQEVDTFQRLPGGGFIEDEKIIRFVY